MKKYQVVIVGNGEPALACAISARYAYSHKNIAIIKTDKQNSLIEDALSTFSNGFIKRLDVFYYDIVGRSRNTLYLSSGGEIEYEKLVLATGSRAIEPQIEDLKKDGVIFISQDPEQINKAKKEVISAESIVIFGGGYMGVELCDELLMLGKKVTLIEKNKKLLPSAFDLNISNMVKEEIENHGGIVLLGTNIKSVHGIDTVTGVKLDTDEILWCDFLMFCCGSRPNVEIAEKLGVIFDNNRGILVDGYFKTSDKDIFAVGECAAKFDFFSSDFSSVLVQDTQIEEAKLLGANLYSVIFNRNKMNDYLSESETFKTGYKTRSKKPTRLEATKAIAAMIN